MSPHVFAGFAERLEAARLAKGMTKAHVCDALGLPNQRYVTLMRGGGIKHLSRLAALLGVRVEWLTTGSYPPEWYRPEVMRFTPAREHSPAEEQESAETTAQPVSAAPAMVNGLPATSEPVMSIPVIGEVTAGSGWAEPSQDPDDWKPIPIRSHWRAVRIQGDSGHPVVWDGQTVIVDDRLPLKHNRLVVVQTEDRRAYLKRYCVCSDVPSGFVLASVNIGRDSFVLPPHMPVRMAVVVGTLYTDSVVG
jgi:SOS-response transcriptional repressor LexA